MSHPWGKCIIIDCLSILRVLCNQYFICHFAASRLTLIGYIENIASP